MSIPKKEKSTLTFEAAMARLEEIVEEMENADLPLESILRRYEEGAKLREFCEEQLKQAEQRVEKIVPATDGSPQTESFDDVEEG